MAIRMCACGSHHAGNTVVIMQRIYILVIIRVHSVYHEGNIHNDHHTGNAQWLSHREYKVYKVVITWDI